MKPALVKERHNGVTMTFDAIDLLAAKMSAIEFDNVASKDALRTDILRLFQHAIEQAYELGRQSQFNGEIP